MVTMGMGRWSSEGGNHFLRGPKSGKRKEICHQTLKNSSCIFPFVIFLNRPTLYLSNITFFLFSFCICRVHLDLQTFSSPLFISNLLYHLFLPLVQIKQMNQFHFYVTTDFPSLNYLANIYFLPYQQKLKFLQSCLDCMN